MSAVTGSVHVSNEQGDPLQQAPIEAFNSLTGEVLQVADTDNRGVATFSNLSTTVTVAYRARVTRNAGKSGELTNTGIVHIREITAPALQTTAPPTIGAAYLVFITPVRLIIATADPPQPWYSMDITVERHSLADGSILPVRVALPLVITIASLSGTLTVFTTPGNGGIMGIGKTKFTFQVSATHPMGAPDNGSGLITVTPLSPAGDVPTTGASQMISLTD